ncbi:hypothetical protein GCM10017750_00420 [Streptomyces racemochromogenes]
MPDGRVFIGQQRYQQRQLRRHGGADGAGLDLVLVLALGEAAEQLERVDGLPDGGGDAGEVGSGVSRSAWSLGRAGNPPRVEFEVDGEARASRGLNPWIMGCLD